MSRLGSFGSVLPIAAAALVALAAAAACEKKSDAAQARDLFASTCARCHGADGNGGLALFDGGPSPRNFRDHAFHQGRTDEQIKLTIMNGKGTGMPAFGATFTEPQLQGLVAHVRSFDSKETGK